MQNTTETCQIQQLLCQIQTFFSSKDEFYAFRQLLKDIVSNLINYSSDGKYNRISKEEQIFASTLWNIQRVRDFLLLLGYVEENECYVFNSSDENMIKLQNCLGLLEDYVTQEGHGITDEEKSCGSDKIKAREMSKSKAAICSGKLKELLLSKHLKKEQSDNMMDAMKCEKKAISKSSGLAFCNNGYFHQSSSNRDKKSRCLFKDLFHQQDHDIKRWSSHSFNVKLV